MREIMVMRKEDETKLIEEIIQIIKMIVKEENIGERKKKKKKIEEKDTHRGETGRLESV